MSQKGKPQCIGRKQIFTWQAYLLYNEARPYDELISEHSESDIPICMALVTKSYSKDFLDVLVDDEHAFKTYFANATESIIVTRSAVLTQNDKGIILNAEHMVHYSIFVEHYSNAYAVFKRDSEKRKDLGQAVHLEQPYDRLAIITEEHVQALEDNFKSFCTDRILLG